MSGATALFALILDRAAPLPKIHLLRDRTCWRRSTVHPIPHIMNVAERTKLTVDHWSRPKVNACTSLEC
jgi:hypothetical protein